MKLYQLTHEIVTKFAPTDKTTEDEMQTSAFNAYTDYLADLNSRLARNEDALKYNTDNLAKEGFVARKLEKLTLANKIMQYLETWWVRYIIAFLFIFLVPRIKDYMHGGGVDNDEDEDNEVSEFEQFMNFQRMKKTMR